MKRTGLFILMTVTTLLTACGEQDEIRVIEVAQPAAYVWPTTERREDTHEQLIWEVPAGWVTTEDVADALIADYRFSGTTHDLPGRMTVSKIDGDGGGLAANLNRWRGQFFFNVMLEQRLAGLEDLSPTLPFAYGTLQIVELRGDYRSPTVPTSMIAAIFTFMDQQGRPYMTWFFKLTGDRETLAKSREAFFRTVFSFRRQGDEKLDLDRLMNQALPEPEQGGDAADRPDDASGPGAPDLLRRPEGDGDE